MQKYSQSRSPSRAASVAHPIGLVDFMSACPALQRSAYRLVAATPGSNPNGNRRGVESAQPRSSRGNDALPYRQMDGAPRIPADRQ